MDFYSTKHYKTVFRNFSLKLFLKIVSKRDIDILLHRLTKIRHE